MLPHVLFKSFPRNPHQGFTLLEVTIVIALIAIGSFLGFTNLTAQKQKQTLQNYVHQLQTAIDTAKTRSVAVTPNVSGTPSRWGLYLDFTSNKFTLGPYDPDNFIANPPGSQTTSLAKGFQFTSASPVSNPRRLLISFDRLTGSPNLYKKPGNTLVKIHNWEPQAKIGIQSPNWTQTIYLNANGATSITLLTKN